MKRHCCNGYSQATLYCLPKIKVQCGVALHAYTCTCTVSALQRHLSSPLLVQHQTNVMTLHSLYFLHPQTSRYATLLHRVVGTGKVSHQMEMWAQMATVSNLGQPRMMHRETSHQTQLLLRSGSGGATGKS